MIVLVTGGRDYTGQYRLWVALDMLRREVPIGMAMCVVEGGANGADRLARRWFEDRRATPGAKLYWKAFPADWIKTHYCRDHTHGREGAGPCRNARMIEWVVAQKAADKRVLACPGGRGAANCVSQARGAGLVVKTLDEYMANGWSHKCSWCGAEHLGGTEQCQDGP